MTKNKPDDPFRDDDWGTPEDNVPGEMPDADPRDKAPFLKPYDLKTDRGKLELIEVTNERSEYSDVILLVALGTKRFRLGMRTFSPDYKRLLVRFGKKQEAWKGTLEYRVMPHKGNPRGYVAVR